MRAMTTTVIGADNAAKIEASLRDAYGNSRRAGRFQWNGRRGC